MAYSLLVLFSFFAGAAASACRCCTGMLQALVTVLEVTYVHRQLKEGIYAAAEVDSHRITPVSTDFAACIGRVHKRHRAPSDLAKTASIFFKLWFLAGSVAWWFACRQEGNGDALAAVRGAVIPCASVFPSSPLGADAVLAGLAELGVVRVPRLARPPVLVYGRLLEAVVHLPYPVVDVYQHLDDLLRVPHGRLVASHLALVALLAVQLEGDEALAVARQQEPERDAPLHRRPAVAAFLAAEAHFGRVDEGLPVDADGTLHDRKQVPGLGHVLREELLELRLPHLLHAIGLLPRVDGDDGAEGGGLRRLRRWRRRLRAQDRRAQGRRGGLTAPGETHHHRRHSSTGRLLGLFTTARGCSTARRNVLLRGTRTRRPRVQRTARGAALLPGAHLFRPLDNLHDTLAGRRSNEPLNSLPS